MEALRRQHAVMVVGPGLLPALLHCIRIGHLTLALEQKALSERSLAPLRRSGRSSENPWMPSHDEPIPSPMA